MTDDITEALRESAARYRTLFEQAPIGVYVYDVRLRITECNAKFCTILSSTFERLIGLDIRTLRDKSVVPAIERALLGEPTMYTGPYEATTSDAKIWISMRLAPLRDRDGVVVGGMGLVEDVTEQRSAEDALRASEARFRGVVEFSPDLVGVMRRGTLLYVNPAVVRNWGYDDPREILGRNASEFVHPDERPLLADRVARAARGESLPAYEYRIVRRDGSIVNEEIRSILIDYDGAPALLAIGRDVTERKSMQARLLQADRMASVGTLAAGIAHEINNPLAYLMANLEMVAHRTLPDLAARVRALEDDAAIVHGGEPQRDATTRFEKLTHMISVAREGAERVRHTVRDLKTFSRPDDDERTRVDVRRVLDASIDLAWNELRHRAEVVREYEETEPVWANESRLGQVFLNLLVNAAQAIPVGHAADHCVRVRVFTVPADRTLGERVAVEVCDTGHGIAREHVARLFDPFFTTKAVGVGTGLGLWICQGIVTTLGGTITVRSEEGEETTFRVELPAYAPETSSRDVREVSERSHKAIAAARKARESQPDAKRRGRVLIVDDEESLARVLASVLSSEHEVVVTTSGREALELLARDQAFDVVLCDLMMPDVSGMELYEALRSGAPDIADRIVFVTGGAFTPRARDFLEATGAPRIEKPFDLDRLRAAIAARID